MCDRLYEISVVILIIVSYWRKDFSLRKKNEFGSSNTFYVEEYSKRKIHIITVCEVTSTEPRRGKCRAIPFHMKNSYRSLCVENSSISKSKAFPLKLSFRQLERVEKEKSFLVCYFLLFTLLPTSLFELPGYK